MDQTVDRSATDLATPAGDVDLVERARSGDAVAFDRLVASRVDAAFRTARAILRDDADAADATQETFFQVWRDLPSLRDPARFDAWAGRILMNRCRTALRRRRAGSVRAVRLIDDGDGRSEPVDLHSFADEQATSDGIRRAFERLTESQRELLAFHHAGGLGVAEIAAMTDAPVGTVKWRLHDARRALERALEAER